MDLPDLAPDAPWDLLARYLAGEATPTEQAELRTWARQRPEHQAILTETTQAWQKAQSPLRAAPFGSGDVDTAWRRFETQVWGAPPAAPAPPASPPPTMPPTGWLTGIGKAAGLLAVGVGAGWWLHSIPARPSPAGASLVPTTTVMGTDAGSPRQRSSVPLLVADSAKVLAADSAAVSADLVFENAPLAEVAHQLVDRFGVRIVLVDSALVRCRFTGTFHQPQPEQVLLVVSVATSTTLTQLPDSSWQLRGHGCDPVRLP